MEFFWPIIYSSIGMCVWKIINQEAVFHLDYSKPYLKDNSFFIDIPLSWRKKVLRVTIQKKEVIQEL